METDELRDMVERLTTMAESYAAEDDEEEGGEAEEEDVYEEGLAS